MISNCFNDLDDSRKLPDLCDFAWGVWLSGARQFTEDEIGKQTAEKLVGGGSPVVRRVNGDLEFVNDQIGAYLAARHVFNAVNPFSLIVAQEQRSTLRYRSEQAEIWRFLREMADDVLTVRLYMWALEEPEDRIELQKAFRSQNGMSAALAG